MLDAGEQTQPTNLNDLLANNPEQAKIGVSFEIIKMDSLSINDLIELIKLGYSVARTPHVGNGSIKDFALLKCGACTRTVYYDRTISDADTIFHPSWRLTRGGKTPATGNFKGLSTHSRTRDGESISSLHMAALKAAFPNENMLTYTEYLASIEERVLDAIIFENTPDGSKKLRFPTLWRRYVDSSGKVVDTHYNPETEPNTPDVLGVNADNSSNKAWIIPNEINVIILGIIEAMRTEQDSVIHLSGPSMINYIDDMQQGDVTLDSMYESLKIVFRDMGIKIPETLRFIITPIAKFRFALPIAPDDEETKAALDELSNAWYEWEASKDKENRNTERQRIEYLLNKCRLIFYRTEDANFLTQHDLIELQQQGYRIYVPEWAKTMPLAEIIRLYEAMWEKGRRLITQDNKHKKRR